MIGRPVSVFNCLSSVAVFFILWPRYVTCQDADTPGCWSGNAPLEKGQLTKVCLFVNNLLVSEGSSVSSIVIAPKIDDYSLIFVNDSWRADDNTDLLLNTFGSPIAFHLETEGYVTDQKVFRNTQESRTWPIYTAVIAVDKGWVTDVYWDKVCQLCPRDNCVPNSYKITNETTDLFGVETCFWSYSDCLQSGQTASNQCQLRVYIAWTGTDVHGIELQSYNKRLSLLSGRTLNTLMSDLYG
eukprot:88272_1